MAFAILLLVHFVIGIGGLDSLECFVLNAFITPLQGDGYCFRAISLFLCQQHYEKKAGPICMKFSGKVWSDYGTT